MAVRGSAQAELFEAVRERLEEQLKHAEKSAKALEERRQEYEELRKLLLDLPKKVQHPMMVPFGPLASFPGHLVHTNEVLTQLSSEYFALRTCHQAVQLVDRRLKRIQADEASVEGEVTQRAGAERAAVKVRELTMQQQVAAGETVNRPSARAAGPSSSKVREVPGVPGATVRLDEDGFMDIREPMEEGTTSNRTDAAAEPYMPDASRFWQSAGSSQPATEDDLSRRLRELEEMEEAEEPGVTRSTEDEMLELDQILGQYDDLPGSAPAHEGGGSSVPKAFSPGDLYKLMGDTGRADEAPPVEEPETIVANVIRERQAAPAPAPDPGTGGPPKRVSKFKAERQRG